jgi:hypothetical protein
VVLAAIGVAVLPHPAKIPSRSIIMRAPGHRHVVWLGILLCAAASAAGCGRNQTAPLSEGAEESTAPRGAIPTEAPPELQIEQKLMPLTQDDVELYLKVMRAAAARVKNRPPADVSALEAARKVLESRGSGRTPTADDAKTLERATLLATGMDQIIAQEMKLDARKYRGIAEAVEAVIPNPALPAAPADGKPASGDAPTRLQQRLKDVDAANAKFLAPYREQIQQLLAVVHNPANLPN